MEENPPKPEARLEVVGFKLEVSLRMSANGALLRSGLALNDGAAVTALPTVFADANPNLARFDVGYELTVTLLVMCLNLGNL